MSTSPCRDWAHSTESCTSRCLCSRKPAQHTGCRACALQSWSGQRSQIQAQDPAKGRGPGHPPRQMRSQMLRGTQSSSPLGGSASLLSCFTERKTGSENARAGVGPHSHFSSRLKKNDLCLRNFHLLSSMGLHRRDKTGAKRRGWEPAQFSGEREADALGRGTKLSGFSLVPSPSPYSLLWPRGGNRLTNNKTNGAYHGGNENSSAGSAYPSSLPPLSYSTQAGEVALSQTPVNPRCQAELAHSRHPINNLHKRDSVLQS